MEFLSLLKLAIADVLGMHFRHIEAAALPLVSLTALEAFRAGGLAEEKKVLITGGYAYSFYNHRRIVRTS